jgi:hypothetical protein
MEEVWKDVVGFEGKYEVSNLGRIRSLPHETLIVRNFGTPYYLPKLGRIINPQPRRHGYLSVWLYGNGGNNGRTGKQYSVHRIVAEAFCPNPNGCEEVNHINEDKSDNRACNLEWCTQLDNVAYAAENMKKQKTECRATNTGEKYISLRMSRGGKEYYRVNIRFARADKSFKTIAEAIRYRNEVMQKWQSQ